MTRITNDELEKFRPNVSRCANREVAPLRTFTLTQNEPRTLRFSGFFPYKYAIGF